VTLKAPALLPRLYLITDRHQVPGGDLLACLEAALKAGVRLVQLREKDLSARALLVLAREVQALCLRHGARLLVNDRADVARAVGAGVHLTSSDPPVREVRALLGAETLIGVSTHHPQDILRAATEGASLVTFGPVFDTPSKRGMGTPQGLEGLALAARGAALPVFALGGIKNAHSDSIMAAGAHGVAVISAIMANADPGRAAADLLAAGEPPKNR